MKSKVFYDVETTHEHPQYCDLTLVGALRTTGRKKEVFVWEAPWTDEKLADIKSVICDPDLECRVGFNNVNFDDLVLHNHGVTVPEENTYDAILAYKTVMPGLPSYSLKFLCWWFLGDPHWSEFELQQTGHKFGDAVTGELKKYHAHDLEQHAAIWEFIAEKVLSPEFIEPFMLHMRMKGPLQEMIFEGGVLVDTKRCEQTLIEMAERKIEIEQAIREATDGKIQNPNSNKQVGQYLANIEGWELDLTATGEFQVKKKDLLSISGIEGDDAEKILRAWRPGMEAPFSPVAMLAWQMKDIETLRKYVENYYKAAIETNCGGWIPSAYGSSSAVTLRTLSKSFYKINFQNSTEAIDEFKLVPPGFLMWGIDSSQIENVVHIHESGDTARREAYEKDPEWNEYVWLCNRILGDTKSKKELDSIKSKQVPHWSVYKAYKTAKLSLNFGQGIKAFCEKLGLEYGKGKEIFQDIHKACPAIKSLQGKVERLLERDGYVKDVFGQRYTAKEAYKLVAYLVQGTGTGALPQAQIRANYDTLHKWSEVCGVNVGPLVFTTHDENGGFLRLDLGKDVLSAILEELYENMTTKFSHKFGGIPLRAKLYLSTTNWNDRKNHEVKDINNIKFP